MTVHKGILNMSMKLNLDFMICEECSPVYIRRHLDGQHALLLIIPTTTPE